jgi:hypothetical protein
MPKKNFKQPMKSFSSRLPLFLLAIGAVLRAATYGSAALWYDESVTLYRTSIPFMTLYTARTDNSGCLLLDLMLRPLMALGQSLWILRLPSMLASLVGLWLVWKIMQALQFTPRQQLFGAAFAAFLPGLLWIGQDARSYSLLAMFVLAALYFAIQGRLLGMTACLGLMMYCHNTGPVEAAGVLCVALYLRPTRWPRVLLCGGLACLAWIPAMIHVWTMSVASFGIYQPWQLSLTVTWLAKSAVTALWVSRLPLFNLLAFLLGLASLGLL